MRINKIIKDSRVNGPGRRYTIWVQGCSIHCEGCSNKDTWDSTKGEVWTTQQLLTDIAIAKPEGITLTGGEPLDQFDEVLEFLKFIKDHTFYNVFLTSGYTFEQIQKTKYEILSYIDILISGPFVQSLLDQSGQWRGSTNQIVHFLTERSKKFIDFDKKFKTEIRINKKTHETIVDGFMIPQNVRSIYKSTDVL